MKQAVFNVSRAALLVAALEQGRLDLLSTATEDALHQPPRSRIFPAFPRIIEAALGSGAHGAFLPARAHQCSPSVRTTAIRLRTQCSAPLPINPSAGLPTVLEIDRAGASVTES